MWCGEGCLQLWNRTEGLDCCVHVAGVAEAGQKGREVSDEKGRRRWKCTF